MHLTLFHKHLLQNANKLHQSRRISRVPFPTKTNSRISKHPIISVLKLLKYRTMMRAYRYCISVLPLLIVCLCISKGNVKAVLPQIQHPIEGNRPIKFLVVGDWGRRGALNQSLVARQMGHIGAKLGTDFIVSTGDNFYKDGLTGLNDTDFKQSFTDIYTARSLQKPWYAILGNHDYHGNVQAQLNPLLRRRDRRWHCHRSFIVRAGFLHIFFVDTSPSVNKYFVNRPVNKFNWKGILPRDKYLSNLIKDLNTSLKTSKALWKIVVGHHPIRSIGHRGDTEELLHKLLPILQENKIPMYMNGHDHCLEHINNTGIPIEFLTSGGGSRAWKNDIHHERYKKNLKFYYDGQGFMSVQLTRHKADVAF